MSTISDVPTTTPIEVSRHESLQRPKRYWQTVWNLHLMTWVCLFLACLGASWFSYQYFLVPQPARFAPAWKGAQWVKAADGNAPVAYFRYATNLNALPDAAFMTVAANQVFRLYVNGNLIGSNADDFTTGNFPRAYMYDVTSTLQLRSNVIALRVANVDVHIPVVRANLGLVQGNSISYRGTGNGWQATVQSTLVYPRYPTSANDWTTNNFDASSWPPIQQAASPPISPMLTVNPLLYTQPISPHWMSAGTSHDGYFVHQLSLPDGLTGAWLRLVASGTANIFINGHLLFQWNGQAPIPATQETLDNYLSDDATVTYLSDEVAPVTYRTGLALAVYDVSPYLHSGVNTIAVHVSAPGVSADVVGLNSLRAAMAFDTLVSDAHGHNTWLTTDAGWHTSPQPIDGWTQGSNAALAWPHPILIGRPGAVNTFYLPDSDTTSSVQLMPLSLLIEVILFSIGAVLGLWLLASLLIMRRYYHSRRAALEATSLAYLPAVACEAMLVVLSREPQMPQPFPYTRFWGLALILLVGVGYLLVWLSAYTRRKQIAGNQRTQPLQETDIHNRYPYRTREPKGTSGLLLAVTWSSVSGWYFGLRDRVPRWLRLHWALIPIVLVAIPLICYNLTYEPYWQDELVSYYAAKGILAHGLPVFPSGFLYTKGELYSYVLAFSMMIVGDQGGAPRIVSIVEYLVSLPLLYRIGCHFFDRRVALLATAMLALSPISLVWGRQVRMYEQAQVLALLDVYLFYRALQEYRRARWVYLAVACLVATYLSHEETFIILPALVLCVLVFSRDARHRLPVVLKQKHWWYAAAIGGSLIALQLLIAHVTHPPALGTDQTQRPFVQFTADNIPFYIKLLFFPMALGPGKEPFITVNSLLATIGCIWAIRRSDARPKYCALFLIISLITLVLVFTLQADRYIYPLLPVYYLMGAYALVLGLRSIWTFVRLHGVLQYSRQITMPISGGHISKSMKMIAAFTASVVCACVLIVPILPIGNYNIFISQQAGFSYHRHYPDYDAVGQYMQHHLRKGDIVIAVSPSISILYYVGHVDYFLSVDRALYLFERNGHIVDTPTGTFDALLNQDDLQAVLATHARVWLISDNGTYQLQATKNRKFVFPPDFHIVYEGYGSAVYFRGI